MYMTGSLAECPWNELLQFIERMQLTGSLQVQAEAEKSVQGALGSQIRRGRQSYQLWFDKGFLVGATKPSRSNSLFWLMQHQGWLGYATAQQMAKCCPSQMAVGTYFRQQGALSPQQLQQLFQVQIMAALMFLSQDGGVTFQLDTEQALPCDRLTGLRLSPYDAISLCRQRRSALATAAAETEMELSLEVPNGETVESMAIA